MPLVNSFLKPSQLASEKKYDLTVAFCKQCHLVQLVETVSPDELFRHYIYFSSTSKTILEHNKKTARNLTERLRLNKNSFVLEVASNDGALLQFFQKFNVEILGVDPAKNIAAVANSRGIPTVAEFFNYNFVINTLLPHYGQADLIYGANVLAHVPKIVDFIKGVALALKPKGTAVFEFPYVRGLIENKFDTIYHEHVFYYSLIALIDLFKTAKLELYDVEIVPMQGGSLRIFAGNRDVFRPSTRIALLKKKEIAAGYNRLTTYQKINTRVQMTKKKLLTLANKLKSQGKSVAAYSAPAKGLILLNYFDIGNNFLDFIVDKAKEKQGLYTPGTHMKVMPLSAIDKRKPDYLLILCWNIADEVVAMKELSNFRKRGGKFIVPLPKIIVL